MEEPRDMDIQNVGDIRIATKSINENNQPTNFSTFMSSQSSKKQIAAIEPSESYKTVASLNVKELTKNNLKDVIKRLRRVAIFFVKQVKNWLIQNSTNSFFKKIQFHKTESCRQKSWWAELKALI